MGKRNIILMHSFTKKFQDEILPIMENTLIHKKKNHTKIASSNKNWDLLIK